MLKDFDGHMFKPHGIIVAFTIGLGGKIVSVEVEVVDALLEYNLLLGCTFFYDMNTIVSFIFRVLHFYHQGKIVTIDQFAFCTPDLRPNVGSNIPFVSDSQNAYTSVGVGMLK